MVSMYSATFQLLGAVLQNRGVAEVGRDPCPSSNPTPAESRATLEPRTVSHHVLDILKDGREIQPRWATRASVSPISRENCFSCVQTEFEVSHLCPLALVLPAGSAGMSLAPASPFPPFGHPFPLM